MIEIIYHDGTKAIPCPPGQTGGFENAEGNGEVHCYPLLDGVSAMLMRLEMETYTELRTQKGMLEINFCVDGRFETHFSLRDQVLTDREGYVSLSQLAVEHDISVSHLQKLFKQVYGVPVYHYIKEYRLEQAAVELVRSAKSVTQIAQNAGYDNASKFSECFKKRYGVTPTQYRARAKNASKRDS